MKNVPIKSSWRMLAFLLAAVCLFGVAAGSLPRAFAEGEGSAVESGTGTGSAAPAPVDISKTCELTVYSCGSNVSDAFKADINSSVIIMDLYKIASAKDIMGIDSYDYELVPEFSSLSAILETARTPADGVDNREEYEKLAQEAAKIIKNSSSVSPYRTVTKAAGAEKVSIQEITSGLFLLVPHTDAGAYWEGTGEENDPIVSRVYSNIANYYYLPMLISLPHKRAEIPSSDDPVMTSDTEAWVYELKVYLKPSAEGMAFTEILVSKSLIGRGWRDGDSFTFTLAALDGAPAPELSEVTVTRPEAVSFGVICYERTGTYTYTIAETVPEDTNGITYDTAEHTVVVTVTKGEDNDLKAEVKYDDSDSLTITNTYQSSGLIVLEAVKTYKGATLKDGMFSFELFDAEGKLIETVKNGNGGKIEFTPLPVDESFFAEDSDTAELTFTVKEKVPVIKATGVTYDTRTYTASVTLTDNGDGTISSQVEWSVKGTAVSKAEFVNSYSTNPKTGDTLDAMRVSALLILAMLIAGFALIMIHRKRDGK